MPTLQANLQPKNQIPVPKVKITLLQIIINTVLRLGYASLLGAAICMLCSVAKAFMASIFGRGLLLGIWNVFIGVVAKLLPFSLAPYASFIAAAIPLSLIGVSLVTALWTNTLTDSISNKESHLKYAFICWILPPLSFAIALNTGLLSLQAAYWLTFALGTGATSWWVAITPALEEYQLLLFQRSWFASYEEERKKQASAPMAGASTELGGEFYQQHTPLFHLQQQQHQQRKPLPEPSYPSIRIIEEPELPPPPTL